MSDLYSNSRLDADGLDEIIAQLELNEASMLERTQLWFKDFLRMLWEWLEELTGGEKGWLSQFNQWLSDTLSGLTGTEPIDADIVLNTISWLSFALVVSLGIYLVYRLWQTYQSVSVDDHSFEFSQQYAHLTKPLQDLPPHQQAAAIFIQACLYLAAKGQLKLHPDATNTNLAAQAQIPDRHRLILTQLAEAADRALFGGWQPSNSDLLRLIDHKNDLMSEAGSAT